MISINWIIDLIDNIPYILSFVIPGYIFLSTYYWVSFVDHKNFNNLIIKSVAASYILGIVFEESQDHYFTRPAYYFTHNYWFVIRSNFR